ncbi:hypothetical protein L6452_16705 [Arctium lappa]|uniref:Uncharacterized protein n=1 Tax=Arctium lappa TaxID=4217 RepID=A0ACB9C1D0_ARCLA|nr:hypothetical protein L6452_16705 [Arctium lappa]
MCRSYRDKMFDSNTQKTPYLSSRSGARYFERAPVKNTRKAQAQDIEIFHQDNGDILTENSSLHVTSRSMRMQKDMSDYASVA